MPILEGLGLMYYLSGVHLEWTFDPGCSVGGRLDSDWIRELGVRISIPVLLLARYLLACLLPAVLEFALL